MYETSSGRTPGAVVWVERRKYPDVPHRGHFSHYPGEDEHGMWFQTAASEPIRRGSDVLFVAETRMLFCAPRDEAWLASFPTSGPFELYVDIVDRVEHGSASIQMVDLDLDIVRYRTGGVEMLDEDEFARHQAEFGYPAALIEHAIVTAQRVMASVISGDEPFGGRWAAFWGASAADGR